MIAVLFSLTEGKALIALLTKHKVYIKEEIKESKDTLTSSEDDGFVKMLRNIMKNKNFVSNYIFRQLV